MTPDKLLEIRADVALILAYWKGDATITFSQVLKAATRALANIVSIFPDSLTMEKMPKMGADATDASTLERVLNSVHTLQDAEAFPWPIVIPILLEVLKRLFSF